MHGDNRLPHALRLAVLFLRIVLGLNFFYLGWSTLFNSATASALRERSMSGLYAWLASPSAFASIPSTLFAWIFLIAGILITIGLFTRLASLAVVAVILANILPAINFQKFSLTQLVNGEVIALFSLFVLVFAKAGTYFGIDKFLHWRKARKGA